MYQKRKERANEMVDNYDYLSQDKEKMKMKIKSISNIFIYLKIIYLK